MRRGSETGAIREMFDQVASRYDLTNRVATFGLDAAWRRRAAALASEGGATTILDVCAGTGELTRAVADRIDGGTVVGVDFSGKMLEICREKTSRYSKTIALAQAGADAMPVAPGAADAACSAFALRNVEPIMDEFLGELERALRPGGRIVLLEIGRPTMPLLRGLYSLYLSWVLPLEGRLLAGVSAPYRYLDSSIRRFPAPAEFCRRLEAAGFERVAFERLSMGIATIFTGSKPAAG